MKHLGDITQIRGCDIEPVDVITGGSPCQDLSIAGARKGLSGERSGLFMEQIRIIKEMREASKRSGRSGESVQCRWAIWENVPGSFSSNKGRDFQAVLTEFVRVSEPDAPDVPMPPKNKWPKSGWLYDGMGRWSVAWKQHDAQFWGVPQRRKRIALVADFNGLSAPAVLFDPQYRRETEGTDADETKPDSGGERRSEVQALSPCLSGHSQQSGAPRKGTAEGTQGGFRSADRSDGTDGTADSIGRTPTGSGNCEEENEGKTGTISFQERAGKPGGGARESSFKVSEQEPCPPSTTSPSCSVDVYNQTVDGQTSGTVTAATGGTNTSGPKVMEVVPIEGNGQRQSHRGNGHGETGDPSFTLNSTERHAVAEVERKAVTAAFMGGQGSKTGGLGYREELSPSLKSVPSGGNTVPDVVHSVHQNASGEVRESDVSYTVGTNQNASGRNTPLVRSVDCRNGTENENTNATLQAKPNGGFSINCGIVIREKKE